MEKRGEIDKNFAEKTIKTPKFVVCFVYPAAYFVALTKIFIFPTRRVFALIEKEGKRRPIITLEVIFLLVGPEQGFQNQGMPDRKFRGESNKSS